MNNKINLKVEYLDIDKLKMYENNAKLHQDEDINAIKKSIELFGFDDPIGIWSDENVIVEGHGRLIAAKKLKMKKVPVIRLDHLSDEERKAYALAHNKITELSEWENEILNLELDDLSTIFDMSEFGFDLDNILQENEKTIIEDKIPDDDNIKKRCRKGDIWKLGDHRLICGDSTDENVIKRLMNNKKADMIFTDPPYNMQYCGDGFINEELKDNVRNRIKDIIDFDAKSISYLASGKYANSIFIFTSKDLIKDYLDIFSSWAFNLLVWHKTNTPPMVNNNFFSDTEYLLYFHKGKRVWNNGLKPIDIYKKYFVTSISEAKKEAGENFHPTMKPLTIISNEVRICSNKKGIVLDLFGGSGSTLIASDQLDRICYICELDEHYCDVIIQRWENLTGGKAELIENIQS